jgi:chromate transport protein ChrA
VQTFGGGLVVLPLIRGEVVPLGWVDDAAFAATTTLLGRW